MGTGTRIAITLTVVVVLAGLWWLDERLSRRPGYERTMRNWAERVAKRRRAQGLRRPSFVIGVTVSSVALVALLWSAR